MEKYVIYKIKISLCGNENFIFFSPFTNKEIIMYHDFLSLTNRLICAVTYFYNSFNVRMNR